VIKVFVALHRSLARCHSFRTSELYLSINLGAFYRCWLLAAGCWLLAAGCWLLAAGKPGLPDLPKWPAPAKLNL
jgi:hypothetical protein